MVYHRIHFLNAFVDLWLCLVFTVLPVFLAAASGGYSLLVVLCGLLIVAVSLVEVACGLNSCCSGALG